MTSYERDTSIVYNDAEDTAVLCTFSLVIIRRMDKLVSKTTDIVVRKHTDDYADYVFQKKMVKVSIPRSYSEEQRKLMQERAGERFGHVHE